MPPTLNAGHASACLYVFLCKVWCFQTNATLNTIRFYKIQMVSVMCTAAIKRLSFIFERFRHEHFSREAFALFIDGSFRLYHSTRFDSKYLCVSLCIGVPHRMVFFALVSLDNAYSIRRVWFIERVLGISLIHLL